MENKDQINQNPEVTPVTLEENAVSTNVENSIIEEIPAVQEIADEVNPVVGQDETITNVVDPEPETVAELEYLEQVSVEAQTDTNLTTSASEELHFEANSEDLHTDEDELGHEEIQAHDVNYDEYTREQLVELLEKTVEETDVNVIKLPVTLIKVAYLKLTKEEKNQHFEKFLAEGGVKEEYQPEEDPLDEKFRNAFNIYKHNKNKYNEIQEEQKLRNFEEKKQILEELKSLINSEETLKKTYDDFRALQEKWKQIGMVPRLEANGLWQNYHFLVEKFFDKVKINNELKDLDLKKNLEAKVALSEKAEALLLEPSILKSFKQLQQYHEEWKEIGPVPQDKKDEIWNRFKDATDKINERRREYYDEVKGEQENNLMAKNALADQAEKIASSTFDTIKQWQDGTTQMSELQKIWRTIGPAPKAQNEQVWQRFRTHVEHFFNTKKEHFSGIKEEQMNNYNLKLDLCTQAEALKTSTDWKKTTQDLIKLQEEWKKIGPVPRKHSDKIWKKFRAACDEFFTSKSNYFSNVHASEAENLARKEELIKKVEEYQFSEDRKQNLETLNSFQREWMDIGHVPIKEKERLQLTFRKAINKQLDKLKISAMEMTTMEYKQRYDNLVKDSPDSIRILSKEKTNISQRVKQLQEDIHLWENNIGFLAASKNAAILKEEFEKKIQKAKEEVKLMEAKLKLLRES